jgi:hypothetical protein
VEVARVPGHEVVHARLFGGRQDGRIVPLDDPGGLLDGVERGIFDDDGMSCRRRW